MSSSGFYHNFIPHISKGPLEVVFVVQIEKLSILHVLSSPMPSRGMHGLLV